MLGTEDRSAECVAESASGEANFSRVPARGGSIMSRLLLALVLAATSVLIPGEADRFLEAQLTWWELAPSRRRSDTSSEASAAGALSSPAARIATVA